MDRSAHTRVCVREARPEDDAVIGELLVEAFVTRYREKLPHVVYGEERKQELRAVAAKRAAATVLVAELDGRVVGTATLVPPGAPGGRAWREGAAELRHLATASDLHGAGLSAPLMDAVEALAWRSGATGICLHVRRQAGGVGRLYARRGYVRAPEGDLLLPSVELDAYHLPAPGRRVVHGGV